MAALPYIQLYVADYLADTMHLTIAESGAYLHLIMNYWQTGKPLPSDEDRLARIARASPEDWQKVRLNVLEYFELRDNFYYHKRIDKELKKVAGKGLTNADFNDGWKGYIYFIAKKDANEIKIGYSKNPWARLKDLQTSSSSELLLVATVKTTDSSEKKIHSYFKEEKISGEWFKKSEKISFIINGIHNDNINSPEDIINYCRNYRSSTVATTKDTDINTDPDTDPNTDINNNMPKNFLNATQAIFEQFVWVYQDTPFGDNLRIDDVKLYRAFSHCMKQYNLTAVQILNLTKSHIEAWKKLDEKFQHEVFKAASLPGGIKWLTEGRMTKPITIYDEQEKVLNERNRPKGSTSKANAGAANLARHLDEIRASQ